MRNKGKYKKSFFLVGALGMIIIFFLLSIFYFQKTINQGYTQIIIPRNITTEKLDKYVNDTLGLFIPGGFSYWAEKFGYRPSPSKFVIDGGVNFISLLKKLRLHRGQTINLTIIPGSSAQKLISNISQNLLITEEEIELFINDEAQLSAFNVDNYTWPTLFIPNTYNIAMKSGLSELFERMQIEKNKYWDSSKLNKLSKQNLSEIQVYTLASIVTKESNKKSEYENIAGVYINRLRKGMKLQADPTLVFIRGRGGRVYKKDMLLESPFNTYKYKGLPPGPICVPNTSAITAVLDYSEHNYLYFCAKEDLSGFHNFARTYKEHLVNARRFQRKLNQMQKK